MSHAAHSEGGSDEEEEFLRVFQLIDTQRSGRISEAALAQALLSTSLLDEAQSRVAAAEAVRDGRVVDVAAFGEAIRQVVEDAKTNAMEGSSVKRPNALPSIGSALL